MAARPERAAARIHWLVAGRFSGSPTGRAWVAAAADLDAQLAAAVGEVAVTVPDRLGGAGSRTATLRPTSLRAFTLAGMIEAVEPLKALRALAERPPAGAAAAEAVEKLVGPGKLAAACAAGPVKPALEAAIFGTALDLLSAEPLRSLEASWRGLKLLLAACPEGAGLEVELLDALPDDVPAALRARPPSDAFDEPDAILVTEPVASLDALVALADVAEELLAPCLASPEPALLGAAGAEALAEWAARGEPAVAAWEALRESGAARWLCCPVNPPLLHAEGAGAYRRVVLGSPTWPVAAMLSASYRAQGAFARCVGKAGALQAPATATVASGPQRGRVAPTEAFLPIPAQAALARQGLLGLGSVLDSDRIVLAEAPMAAKGATVAPLPAQLLTGRIVRFARWAKGQIAPSMTQDEVSALLVEAAGIFLFPGMPGAAAVGARLKDEGGVRSLEFGAKVAGSHALQPLEIAFELPL